MTASDIKTRLAAIEQAMSGIAKAYAQLPAGTPALSNLPAFINKMGTSQLIRFSDTLWYENRVYQCQLLVANVQKGISGEAEGLVETMIEPCRDAFLSHPGLGIGTSTLVVGLQKAVMLGDSGIRTITFSGVGYIGVEYRLQIAEEVVPVIASYE